MTLSDLTDATATNKTYISCPAKTTLSVGTSKISIWADIGGGVYKRLTPDASIFVYGMNQQLTLYLTPGHITNVIFLKYYLIFTILFNLK